MKDPYFTIVLFLLLAVYAIAVSIIGIRRGKVVAIFNVTRDTRPSMFWFGIVFQLLIGIMCLGGAIVKFFM